MTTLTRERRNVKPSRMPAPRKPFFRCCDGTELVNPEPVCTVDYSNGSLAWQVETLLELDERDHENAMIREYENDAEAQHLATLAAERSAWERKQFGYGLFPL